MRSWTQDDWKRALTALRWTRTAGWAMVVIGVLYTGMFALMAPLMFIGGAFEPQDMPEMPFPLWGLGVVYLIFAVISLVITVLTWRCATITGKLLRHPSTEGLAHVLRRYRQWWWMAGVFSVFGCLFGVVGWIFNIAVALQ
ncbi:MAG: hypothetical protein AAF533_24500 [Acidobacteriota bacterium]